MSPNDEDMKHQSEQAYTATMSPAELRIFQLAQHIDDMNWFTYSTVMSQSQIDRLNAVRDELIEEQIQLQNEVAKNNE